MSRERNLSPGENTSPPPTLDTFRVDLKSYKQRDFDQFADDDGSGHDQHNINTTTTMEQPNTPDSGLQVRFANETLPTTSTSAPPTVPQVIISNMEIEQVPEATSTQKSGHTRNDTVRSNVSDDLVDAYRAEYVAQSTEYEDTVDSSLPFTSQKVNRPQYVLWKQQKLPAWQPVYRPANIIGSFLIMGCVLLAMGTYMYISTEATQEYVLDYTHCRWKKNTSFTCADLLARPWFTQPCECEVTLNIKKDMRPPVFLYYSLEGFYQNHRRYVSSVDYYQLIGREDLSLDSIRSHCKPFSDINGSIIGPCGAVANSFFTDTFKMKQNYGEQLTVEIGERDIAWPTDKAYRFKNANNVTMENYSKPINWTMKVTELDPSHPSNNGFQNEHLIVWMRTAAFPTFRKLWGNVDANSTLAGKKSGGVLPKGNYNFTIQYKYRTVFDGLHIPKKLILSNTSWLGGRNFVLPYLYLGTGGACILIGVFFLILVRVIAKRNKENTKTAYGTMLNTNPKVISFANSNFEGFQAEHGRPEVEDFEEIETRQ